MPSRRLLGLRGALLTGLILAISPSEIRYAQEIGEYALMLFALTWMLNLLEWALRASSWKLWGIWMVFSVISVYTHYGSIITVISLTLVSLFFSVFVKNWRVVFRQILVCLLGFVITLPLFIFFLRQQIQSLPHNFIIPNLSVRELINFVSWMDDTFLFSLACWPYSLLPKWIGQLVVSMVFVVGVFVVVRPYLKEGSKTIIGLIIAYTFYYVFVRTGLYGYGVPGFRYALILSPLFFLTCSAVIEYLLVSRKITLSIIMLLSICLISIYSLPNRTVLRITGNESRWLDVQEDLREVVKFWSYYRQIDEPTYVYYGAAPAFQYYLMLYNIDRYPLPPGWFYVCWKGESQSLCSRNGVFYGEFLRAYSAEEKILSVRKSLGIIPSRFWIIFSHVYRDEDAQIVKGLINHYKYNVLDFYQHNGASLYLIGR